MSFNSSFSKLTFSAGRMANCLAAVAGYSLIAVAPRSASAVTPPTASASISASQLDPVTYQYSATLTDASSSASTIGTFWFAWTPGKDFMNTSPLSVTNPTGWTDAITHGGSTDGYAIQWKATNASFDLPVGSSLSGFAFTSSDSPTVISGNSLFFPTTPITTSVSYSGAPFSDAGTTFTVPVAVPEPVSAALFAPLAFLLGRRKAR